MSYSDLHDYKRIYSGKNSSETNFTHTHTSQDEKPLEKAENLEVRVHEFLKENPGLTGMEIALKLCVHELIVYNVLIEKLKDVCYKDENNRWFLKTSGLANKTKESQGSKTVCPFCGSVSIEKKGFRHSKQRFICKSCHKNWTDGIVIETKKDSSKPREHIQKQTINSQISEAYKNHLAISMHYKGFPRTIHPYCVNDTYCVGFCTSRNDLRTFRIDRMRSVTIGNEFQFDSSLSRRAENQINNVQSYYKKRY
jgi:transposase-like protein